MVALGPEAVKMGGELNESTIATKLTAFRTDDPERIALDYTIMVECTPLYRVDEIKEFVAVAQGSCNFTPEDAQVLNNVFLTLISIRSSSGTGSGSISRSLDNAPIDSPFRRPID